MDIVASAAAEAGDSLSATWRQTLSPVATPAVTERPKLSSESIRLETVGAPLSFISERTTSALPIGVHELSLQPVAAIMESQTTAVSLRGTLRVRARYRSASISRRRTPFARRHCRPVLRRGLSPSHGRRAENQSPHRWRQDSPPAFGPISGRHRSQCKPSFLRL